MLEVKRIRFAAGIDFRTFCIQCIVRFCHKQFKLSSCTDSFKTLCIVLLLAEETSWLQCHWLHQIMDKIEHHQIIEKLPTG